MTKDPKIRNTGVEVLVDSDLVGPGEVAFVGFEVREVHDPWRVTMSWPGKEDKIVMVSVDFGEPSEHGFMIKHSWVLETDDPLTEADEHLLTGALEERIRSGIRGIDADMSVNFERVVLQ